MRLKCSRAKVESIRMPFETKSPHKRRRRAQLRPKHLARPSVSTGASTEFARSGFLHTCGGFLGTKLRNLIARCVQSAYCMSRACRGRKSHYSDEGTAAARTNIGKERNTEREKERGGEREREREKETGCRRSRLIS